MSNLVITSIEPGKNTGGIKAKTDIIDFLKKEGYSSYTVNPYVSKLKKLILAGWKIPRDLSNQEFNKVIIQYPIPSERVLKKIIKVIRKKSKKTKIVFLIHDIQGLQSKSNDVIEHELKLFNLVDELIVHNEFMCKWLKSQGFKKKMINLEIFDYDNPQQIGENLDYVGSVCFAGNLFKSEFLKKLTLRHKVSVYGPNMFSNAPKSVEYMGQYSPEELPKHLKQNFGLIWDGPSLETCKGMFGEYMRYNNPHKTSLYISSGTPIIIWEKAALAKFVVENDVGITINNLNQLDDILDSVTPERYIEMKKNTILMAQKLRSGYFLRKAVESI
ncbi:hypothetical protein AYP76_06400 [Ligilactobacillus agilis]|uniref:Beta-1,6-galactofuranosyltransferase n=1 Tax=Ligilactobacillus agilis TaxID=1601 RepID=A0A231Q1Q1_9LACO|nr:beta-1,6-galactofuranosyltransferase [Ligilactobacillus agilis]OXC08288.1 hypothetical protein AYP76_06400 [Ligilactobacillus agilis]OXC10590.1 hypothetical protein AYP75_05780 [Ligilactobacillus agilis]OXC10742.1 hypothetical protein AYP74_03145 [Ligilactobacillus agilis]OXS40548.1 hypothetical protein AYP69_00305 [Ligilactobacillus agilis]OXS41126.1 hypothetical protein AYP70_03650 [Ligilactobacillus agilis]